MEYTNLGNKKKDKNLTQVLFDIDEIQSTSIDFEANVEAYESNIAGVVNEVMDKIFLVLKTEEQIKTENKKKKGKNKIEAISINVIHSFVIDSVRVSYEKLKNQIDVEEQVNKEIIEEVYCATVLKFENILNENGFIVNGKIFEVVKVRDDIYKSVSEEFLARIKRIENSISNYIHKGERGMYYEKVLRDILSRELRGIAEVKTGFVYMSRELEDNNGNLVDSFIRSNQQDIIVAKTGAIYYEQIDDFVICRPEDVYAVIEVKTSSYNNYDTMISNTNRHSIGTYNKEVTTNQKILKCLISVNGKCNLNDEYIENIDEETIILEGMSKIIQLEKINGFPEELLKDMNDFLDNHESLNSLKKDSTMLITSSYIKKNAKDKFFKDLEKEDFVDIQLGFLMGLIKKNIAEKDNEFPQLWHDINIYDTSGNYHLSKRIVY